MLILKIFVTLPLQFNDNNHEGKSCSQWNRAVYIQVCQPSLFSHPLLLRLLCISQTLSPEMDQAWLTGSDSKLWPKPRVLKHVVPENEHEGSDLNSAWELVNLKAEDSISARSIQRRKPGLDPNLHLNMCAHTHRLRHASELHGHTVIILMRFWGDPRNRFIISTWRSGVPERKGFMGQCLEGDTCSTALQQGVKY